MPARQAWESSEGHPVGLPPASRPVKDTFQFVGQAHAGMVPGEETLLVLDTNVVSALDSVARRGFDLDLPTDRRVAHLLSWLHDRPSVAVFHAFGIVEGAGFHRGALAGHSVMRRAFSSLAVIEHGRIHGEEWVASGDPLPEIRVPEDAIHPGNVIDIVEGLLPITVLPCYVTALAAALADRRGQQPLEAATSVFRRLVGELDYVPLLGWMTAALLFLGEPSLRRELRQTLFKFQRADLRLSCLSAAWDLGYLQLLSFIRSPLLAGFFEERQPVLVTEDRQLAPTAILSPCLANSPVFELEAALFDAAWEDEATELMQACVEERLVGGQLPDWSGCTSAAASLECDLGIKAPRLSLRGQTVAYDLSREDLRSFVELLCFDSIEKITESRDRLDPKIDLAGLDVVAGLLADNARAHGRLIEESVVTVLADQLDEEPRSAILITVLNMVRACLRDDFEMMTAWGQKLSVDGFDQWIWVSLWWFAREILADTAIVRGTSREVLIGRILDHMDVAEKEEATQGSGQKVPGSP